MMARGQSGWRIFVNLYHRSSLGTWTRGLTLRPLHQVSRCVVCMARKRSNILNWRTRILSNNQCWSRVLFLSPFLSLRSSLGLSPMIYVPDTPGCLVGKSEQRFPLRPSTLYIIVYAELSMYITNLDLLEKISTSLLLHISRSFPPPPQHWTLPRCLRTGAHVIVRSPPGGLISCSVDTLHRSDRRVIAPSSDPSSWRPNSSRIGAIPIGLHVCSRLYLFVVCVATRSPAHRFLYRQLTLISTHAEELDNTRAVCVALQTYTPVE